MPVRSIRRFLAAAGAPRLAGLRRPAGALGDLLRAGPIGDIVTIVNTNRRRRRWRVTAIVGLLFTCAGVIMLISAFAIGTHGASAPRGGGQGQNPTSDISVLITAVTGLVSAVAGLISAITAWVALHRQRSVAATAAAGPTGTGSERPRLWTPQDGPISDAKNRRG